MASQNLNQDIEYLIRKMSVYAKNKIQDEIKTDSLIRKIGTYTREATRGMVREDLLELLGENKIPYSVDETFKEYLAKFFRLNRQ